MEFTMSKKIAAMVERGKEDAQLRCALSGHDYWEVYGLESGKICVCCGCCPNKEEV